MNKNAQNALVSLCLTLVFLTVGASLSIAQTPTKPNTKQLLELVRAKRSNAPFVLVTPEDLAKASGGENESVSALSDPCEMAVAIDIGQVIGNALNNTDCRLDDGSWADFYVFNGNQGQQIRIFMNSSSIDSYLGLANESGTFVVEDDDSGGGLSALITATLPETGTYIILANSALPNEFGGYQLSVSGPQPCTFSVSPAMTEIPAVGGTFTFTVNTQPECYWQAFRSNNYSDSSSRGRGTGTVTYTVSQNGSGSIRTGSISVSSFPSISFITSFSFTQPSVACNYALQPSSVNIAAAPTNGSFQIIAPAGCPWTVQSNFSFVNAGGSGTGNGTINFSVMQNNGAARSAIITVAGLTFTINQAGLNCTYAISPRQINVGRQGGSGVVNVNTQPGCTWIASRNSLWITIQTVSGTGAGTIPYTVAVQPESQQRSGAIQIFYSLNETSQSTSVWIDQTGTFSNPEFDFNGDGKSNLVVFRPSDRNWYIELGVHIYSKYVWGLATDKIVPADYDGNGRTDIAVFRPENGIWYINSLGGNTSAVQFGTSGDIPVPADYDGDGRADIAVYRPSTGVWYIRKSSDSQFIITQFGLAEDVPTRGDFDGDGKADIALWRPSTGVWYRLNSSDGSFFAYQFGLGEDKPVAADYDGDGKTDIAVWRPSDRVWYRLNSSNNSFTAIQFGLSDDLPTVADYDGDRKADIAVFRPSTGVWYSLNSGNGALSVRQFGLSGDLPVSNAFVR